MENYLNLGNDAARFFNSITLAKHLQSKKNLKLKHRE